MEINVEYTLIGSLTSPFVRKLRLLLLTKSVDFELQAINYLTPEDSKFLKSKNPINKIPVLMIKEHSKQTAIVYDSRIIFQFLSKKYNWSPFSLEDENTLSFIDAMLDSAINLFSLQRAGMDTKSGNNSYIERQWERIDLILEQMKPWVNVQSPDRDWNFLNMSLYSFLDWAQFRSVIALSEYPDYANYLNRFKPCKGVKETEIPKS